MDGLTDWWIDGWMDWWINGWMDWPGNSCLPGAGVWNLTVGTEMQKLILSRLSPTVGNLNYHPRWAIWIITFDGKLELLPLMGNMNHYSLSTVGNMNYHPRWTIWIITLESLSTVGNMYYHPWWAIWIVTHGDQSVVIKYKSISIIFKVTLRIISYHILFRQSDVHEHHVQGCGLRNPRLCLCFQVSST